MRKSATVPMIRVSALLSGLALLVLANASLNDRRFTTGVAIALVLGLACVLLSVLLDRSAASANIRPERKVTKPGIFTGILLVLALIAAAGAWHFSRGNVFRASGVLCWIVAVAAWIAACWPRQQKDEATESEELGVCLVQDDAAKSRRHRISNWSGIAYSPRAIAFALIFLSLFAIGCYFRIARIDEIPRDPTSDHAEKLSDVNDLLNGVRSIYFERNTGREPLQFYLTFGLIRVFDLPLTFTTLKIGTALVGMLALPFIYLLTAELAGRVAGLVALFLYGVAKWPVAISRAGLRFPYGPVFAAASLWLFLRWMRTRDRRDALACGLVLGAGLYGYTPIRVVVPTICLGLLVMLLSSKTWGDRRGVAVDGLLLGITALVVFIPLGHYAIDKPDMFWFRATSRMVNENESNALAAFRDNGTLFARNNLNALLGLNWKGDSTMVNGVTFDPMLDLVTGAFMLAGAAVILAHIVRRRDVRLLFIVLSIPVLTLSSTLALAFPNENPASNREGPVLPFLFAIAAIPVALLLTQLSKAFGRWLGLTFGAVLITVTGGTIIAQNYHAYFVRFDEQYAKNVPNTTEIGSAIARSSVFGVSLNDSYLIDSAYWLDSRNVGIAAGDIDWATHHTIRDGDPIPMQIPGKPILFVIRPGNARLAEIVEIYPHGHLIPQETRIPHQIFLIYWVPPAPLQ